MTDGAVVDRLRETERQIAVLHAEQLALIAEVYRRAPAWITAPTDTPGLIDAAQVAAAEIGVALRISRRSAMDRLGLAVQLLSGLPDTAAALRRGQISLAKARIVTDATADLTTEHTAQVEARILPPRRAADPRRARRRTGPRRAGRRPRRRPPPPHRSGA